MTFRVFSNGAIMGTCDICDTDYSTDNCQLRTWFNDNLCYLTINCDTGQHSQFLRCFENIAYAGSLKHFVSNFQKVKNFADSAFHSKNLCHCHHHMIFYVMFEIIVFVDICVLVNC